MVIVEAKDILGGVEIISKETPPCGAMWGRMPLKVMGPPWMMVMVPVTKRVVSALDVELYVGGRGAGPRGWWRKKPPGRWLEFNTGSDAR